MAHIGTEDLITKKRIDMASEFYEMLEKVSYGEIEHRIHKLTTARLLSELEDTVQMDLIKLSHDEWKAIYREKAIFTEILHELRDRL